VVLPCPVSLGEPFARCGVGSGTPPPATIGFYAKAFGWYTTFS